MKYVIVVVFVISVVCVPLTELRGSSLSVMHIVVTPKEHRCLVNKTVPESPNYLIFGCEFINLVQVSYSDRDSCLHRSPANTSTPLHLMEKCLEVFVHLEDNLYIYPQQYSMYTDNLCTTPHQDMPYMFLQKVLHYQFIKSFLSK